MTLLVNGVTGPENVASSKLFFETVAKLYDFSKGEVLDMFAKVGDLTLKHYLPFVGTADAWELNADCEGELRKLSLRDVKMGCSYITLQNCERKYDFVVVDSPQGVHLDGNGKEHVEHFDILPMLPAILKDEAVVVVYCNQRPYDKNKEGHHGQDEYVSYDFEKWMAARSMFYGTPKPKDLTQEQMLASYRRAFQELGYEVKSFLMAPYPSDVPGRDCYSFRLAMELKKL